MTAVTPRTKWVFIWREKKLFSQ